VIPIPAQYLLRFDDLCPTVGYKQWQRFPPLFEEFKIRPILAVVPENRDHTLAHSAPDPEFWEQMRTLEAAGATIALHGFQHLCKSEGRSLLPLHELTEFAGVAEHTQRRWIHEGLELLRGHGLHPKIWVAPRHGFDRTTLRALRAEGIKALSDGLARVPFRRGGVMWIPQQLWEPVEKSEGLWTICIHSNSTRSSQVDELREFLKQHAAQFTSVDRVLEEFSPSRLSASERMYESVALLRARASRTRKRWARKLRHKTAE
jgi:predicted deacetylase